MHNFIPWWMLAAIVIGSFWGFIAMILYTPLPTGNSPYRDNVRQRVMKLNQFAFNFVGGFAGCYFLYLFLVRYGSPCTPDFGAAAIALLILAVLGICGKLSAVIWELPKSVKDLISSLIAALVKRIG